MVTLIVLICHEKTMQPSHWFFLGKNSKMFPLVFLNKQFRNKLMTHHKQLETQSIKKYGLMKMVLNTKNLEIEVKQHFNSNNS